MTTPEPKNLASSQKSSDEPIVLSSHREKIHEIIFEDDTFWGMFFDVALLVAIMTSIIVICLQTVESYNDAWGEQFAIVNWVFTGMFTAEYLLRLYCVRRPWRYIRSFWGIVDLLSFLPDYITFGAGRIFGTANSIQSFSVLRSLRLLRVFRVFHLGWFEGEADSLGAALWRSRGKVVVFLATVLVIVTVAGTVMYEVEKTGDDNQFDSIPQAIYWAVVTMTTVGYGDIVPHTTAGKFVSTIVILLGYSLIIVPTGFVSAEIVESKRKAKPAKSCGTCTTDGHDVDATFCKYCGEKL